MFRFRLPRIGLTKQLCHGFFSMLHFIFTQSFQKLEECAQLAGVLLAKALNLKHNRSS